MLGRQSQRFAVFDGLPGRDCSGAINRIRVHTGAIENDGRFDQLTVAIEQDRKLYDQYISTGSGRCYPTLGQLMGNKAGYLPANARLGLLWGNWPTSK